MVVLAAWDDLVNHSDQADVEDPEEDLTCAHPVELEGLDQAWDIRWLLCVRRSR